LRIRSCSAVVHGAEDKPKSVPTYDHTTPNKVVHWSWPSDKAVDDDDDDDDDDEAVDNDDVVDVDDEWRVEWLFSLLFRLCTLDMTRLASITCI